jgi:paraquat-inducible protein B
MPRRELNLPIRSVTKAIRHHRQMLGPKAAIHLRHDVLLLQKTIKETLHSLSNLPVDLLTEEIRQELSYVEKIMEQPECSSNLSLNHHVTKKQKKRPTLNIEDPTDPLDFGNWEDDQDV